MIQIFMKVLVILFIKYRRLDDGLKALILFYIQNIKKK